MACFVFLTHIRLLAVLEAVARSVASCRGGHLLAAARQLLLGTVLAGCVGSWGVLAERLIARHHALCIVISLHCLVLSVFLQYAYLSYRFPVSIHISLCVSCPVLEASYRLGF